MKDWTCQQVLKKKRHDYANQLQLLVGYEQMQNQAKVAELLADWMQQLEVERQILSLPLEKTSVLLAYYQSDLALSIDGLSSFGGVSTDAIDEAISEAVNDVLHYVLHHRSQIQSLQVKFVEVTGTHITIHYLVALKDNTGDIVLTQRNSQPFDIEVTSKEIIMKQHVQVNNK